MQPIPLISVSYSDPSTVSGHAAIPDAPVSLEGQKSRSAPRKEKCEKRWRSVSRGKQLSPLPISV